MPDTAPPRWTEYLPVADLQPAIRNAKAHDQVALGASVGAFGMLEPVVMDERTGRLLAGHGRTDHLTALEAAGAEPPDGVVVGPDGRWQWLVVRGISSTDDLHAEAIGVALNRVGERGGWQTDVLAATVDDLAGTAWADAIGWTSDELDDLIASTIAPEVPEVAPTPPVPPQPRQVAKRCAAGQLWMLGRHRLLCGDARNADDVARLLDGATVNLAITSPPYADRRKYDESTEFRPIPPEAYVDWFEPVQANVARHLAPDGSWFVNIKPGVTPDGHSTELYVLDLVAAHARRWGWYFATEFCWERVGVPKSVTRRFKNQFEPVYQFTRGRWKMRPDHVRHASDDVPVAGGPGVGDTGWGGGGGGAVDAQGTPGGAMFGAKKRAGGTSQLMSDVQGTSYGVGEWIGPGMAYPGNRLPTFSGSHEATGHEAAFPVGLPAWFMRAYTDEGDLVLDPFAGSGSTILAAQQEGRIGYGMELSPRYCDIILDRWERHTSVEAVTG